MSYPDWDELKDALLEGRRVPMIEADMPTFMGRPHATCVSDLEGADVVIIGSPYVTGWKDQYAGVDKREWAAAAKRVRQQSAKYPSGFVQEFNLDVFEHLRVVDYGNAAITYEMSCDQSVDGILRCQALVEQMVNESLDAGATPIVIGQNSPCGSYAIAKPLAERAKGNVGVVSLDTHWDIGRIDDVTLDPRIAGGGCWKRKLYEFHGNYLQENLVEIGERGMMEDRALVNEFLDKGTNFYPMWQVRSKGIEWLCGELSHAYEGTDSVYVHFDMDVLGGAGPAPGDILGGLAEPIGMTDYEVLRLAYEVGLRGFDALSFICIPPGSPVIYRVIVSVIMYMLAGRVQRRR